jgi:hypothetical protein
MVYRPPNHGISAPTHSISTPLPMVLWTPYPWHIDPRPTVFGPPYSLYLCPVPMVYWPRYPWYIYPLPMVYRPPIHGILNALPMVFWPPTNGILTPLSMVYWPPYPWYFDLPYLWYIKPFLMVVWTRLLIEMRGVNLPWEGSKYNNEIFLKLRNKLYQNIHTLFSGTAMILHTF